MISENTKDTLINSPLFNLSLANKELFHSNFIAWFGKLYPALFVKLVNTLLCRERWAGGLDPHKMIIRREYKNFDISVFDNEESKVPRLIIENKVKSVPTQEQLLKYQNEINNDESVELLLLTMNEQLHTANDKHNVTRWKVANYTRLSSCLENLIEEIEDPYHRYLIKDYCEYVSQLELVINAYTNNEHYMYSGDEYREQVNLGIHDVCGKRKVQSVYSQLVNEINKHVDVVERVTELKNMSTEVQVAWAYTNAPLIEVRLKTRPEIDEYVLIQIQGKQYRHCVEFFDTPEDKRIEKIDGSFYPSEKGIRYLKETYPKILFGDDALENYPRFNGKSNVFGQRRKGGNEGYCKYCNGKLCSYNGLRGCFVYQWVELPDRISIEDLVKSITTDTLNLINIISVNTFK